MFANGNRYCVSVAGILLLISMAGCPAQKYALTVLTTGQGSVALNPPGGSYDSGQQVTLTATPSANWHFDHWEGALTGTANPAQVTMNAAKTVTAVFAANVAQYTLNVTVTGQGSLGLSPSGGTYAANTPVTLTATPALGWHFDHWEGALTGNTNPAQITMNANKSVTAVFAINAAALNVQVTGQGSVTLNPPGGTYTSGQLVTLTPVPAEGWHFDHWEGALTGSSPSAQLTVTGTISVTAVFVQDQYTLTVWTEGGGSVSLNPPGGTYPSGTVVTLTPVPNSDKRFEIWNGSLQSVAQPATITMNESKYVQAYFMPKQYTTFYPSNLCAVGSTLYFLGMGMYSGQELWKSNGTFIGTRLVKDIAPGSSTSSISFLTNLNGTLYFLAGWNGYGLWKSDGTESGTVQVASLGNSCPALAPVKVGTKIYWSANSTTGGELWSSDGTAAGTGLVKSFGLVTGSTPTHLTDVNGVLYFNNVTAAGTFTLWKSDGTANGTVPIFNAGNLSEIASLNGQVYFYAGSQNTEFDALYSTDGTPAGTHMMREFFFGPGDFVRSGSLLYFAAESNDLYNTRIWATNGNSVYRVSDSTYRPWDLIDLNGKLLFEALYEVNSVPHCGLFATTGAGATLLSEINPTKFYGVESYHVVANNNVFFAAENSYGGLGLWKSDGTSAGTVLVSEINPTGLGPYFMTNVNGTVFFAAQDNAHGYQLWKSNGTTAGTVPVSCP